MGLFSKPEYRDFLLPVIYDHDSEDLYAGLISIEAYGMILGQMKYCYATYMADLEWIDEVAALLKARSAENVKVTVKIKKGKAVDFKLDLNSLAEAYNDRRLRSLELAGWGFNDRSFVNGDS